MSEKLLNILDAELALWAKIAPPVPPALSQTIKQAQRHVAQARFAIAAAQMIERGGLPVPEELRDVVS